VIGVEVRRHATKYMIMKAIATTKQQKLFSQLKFAKLFYIDEFGN
jgi:hypothetical protein